jgi:hypothetical protein
VGIVRGPVTAARRRRRSTSSREARTSIRELVRRAAFQFPLRSVRGSIPIMRVPLPEDDRVEGAAFKPARGAAETPAGEHVLDRLMFDRRLLEPERAHPERERLTRTPDGSRATPPGPPARAADAPAGGPRPPGIGATSPVTRLPRPATGSRHTPTGACSPGGRRDLLGNDRIHRAAVRRSMSRDANPMERVPTIRPADAAAPVPATIGREVNETAPRANATSLEASATCLGASATTSGAAKGPPTSSQPAWPGAQPSTMS